MFSGFGKVVESLIEGSNAVNINAPVNTNVQNFIDVNTEIETDIDINVNYLNPDILLKFLNIFRLTVKHLDWIV